MAAAVANLFTEKSDVRWASHGLMVSILFFCSVSFLQTARGALDPEDEAVLEILRKSFSQPNWTGDPCDNVNIDWITCTDAPEDNFVYVQTIRLGDRNLTGTIPADIAKLEHITELDFNTNKLEGQLPDLSNMESLTILDVSSCALSGNISDLKKSSGLQNLFMQENDFSGSIPPDLFLQHGSLRFMRLNQNPRLSGEIPDMSQLAEIVHFFLHDCNLSGPVPSLNSNTKLKYLELQNNRLTSFQSLNLTMLTVLNNIKVYNNRMSGPLPDLPPASSQGMEQNFLEYILFSNNSFSGKIPSSWSQLTSAKAIKLDSNKLSGVIPTDFGNLVNLEQLNLSYNNFSGPIPDDFASLKKLEILDLRSNQFNGTVPRTLGELPNLKNLWLDNNSFTGIYKVLVDKPDLKISYDPNIKILMDNSKSGVSIGAVVGGVIAVLAIGVIIGVVVIVRRTKDKNKNREDQVNKEDMPKSAQSFSLKEIKAITQNYKTLIGKGGFGPVYLGKLPNGKEVAVKVRAHDSKQGADEFLNEVRLLSRLHHRNLVSLVGYCLESQEQILLYLYMPHGTLQDNLYRTGSKSNPSSSNSEVSSTRETLSWKQRLDIAINAARGLEYLHKDCKPPVIHRDVKSANILLTDKLEAKVADLGISKQAPELDTEIPLVHTGVSTVVKGTPGYMDPEYYVRRRLTTKSDVYSFGIVLLEIITGKRPQTQRFPRSDAATLAEWVQHAVNMDQVESVVDPALRGQYEREGLLKVARTALICLLPSGGQRPEMGDVVRALTQALEMEGDYIDIDTSARTNEEDDRYPFSSTTGTSSSMSSGHYAHPSWNTMPR